MDFGREIDRIEALMREQRRPEYAGSLAVQMALIMIKRMAARGLLDAEDREDIMGLAAAFQAGAHNDHAKALAGKVIEHIKHLPRPDAPDS